MKKIYLSFIGTFFLGSVSAQNLITPVSHRHSAQISSNTTLQHPNSSNSDRDSGPFRLWVEPVGDIMYNKNVDTYQSLYAAPIFMDSTVTDGDGSYNSSILLGSVLDPQSILLQSSADPIVGPNDSYNIDSLMIYGSYVKITATVDTLYTWLVWGSPSDTNVFAKMVTNDVWVYPISTWRDSVIGPKIVGATGAPGNQVTAAAPSSNKILIKYVLQSTDSVAVAGYLKGIKIALPTPLSIPAGNIVSCFYTFVPGTTYSLGDCFYSFQGSPQAQIQNGFAGVVWEQSYPQLQSVYDYQDQQVDNTSWCMSGNYDKGQRHNVYPSPFPSLITGNLTTAPLIYYSIYGVAALPLNSPIATSFTSNTCTSFNANWQAVSGATGYLLDVSTSPLFASFFSIYNNDSVGNVTTYNVTGVATNTTYYYRVRATDGYGTSLYSNTITVAFAPPVAPTALSATNSICTSFNANWSAVTGATQYSLDVSTDANFNSFLMGYNDLSVVNTSYTVTGLTSNTTYYYRVRASDSCSLTSNSSNTSTAITCNITGINEYNSNENLKIYPNPANDKIIVSTDKVGANIIITDILGETVRQVVANQLQTEITISDLQDGVYFVKATQDNTTAVQKIIIKK